MFSVGSDFSRGIGYVFKGIMGFWKRPRLWVYAMTATQCTMKPATTARFSNPQLEIIAVIRSTNGCTWECRT